MTTGTAPLVVLCVYRDGRLPAAWFQVVRRLRHRVERLGLDVDIRLAPLSAARGDADLVVVPAALASAAGKLGPRARIVAPGGEDRGQEADKVVAEVQALARARPPGGRPTVVRRGFRIADATPTTALE